MGKLILCSGTRTERPYVFTQTGMRIYSMEELCYYLCQHVYMIDEDLFCESLFDFIAVELELPQRAEKLRVLKKQKADMKTLTAVILCSTDYYTEYEIKSVLKILDDIIGMPMIKRNCIKARSYLKAGQFSQAAAEYVRIINSNEASKLTPEEYGDLYHNLAAAIVHITGLKEASKLYLQAYERNHRKESLRQYLLTLRLCNNASAYQNKMEEYQMETEFVDDIEVFFQKAQEKADHAEILYEINDLREMKAQGKMTEFYHKANEMIEMWKDKVRQN